MSHYVDDVNKANSTKSLGKKSGVHVSLKSIPYKAISKDYLTFYYNKALKTSILRCNALEQPS